MASGRFLYSHSTVLGNGLFYKEIGRVDKIISNLYQALLRSYPPNKQCDVSSIARKGKIGLF